MEVVIEINKSVVYREVSKTTAYQGSKAVGDNDAYDRVALTDYDLEALERYWNEASCAVDDLVKNFAKSIEARPQSHGVELGNNYKAVLEMGARYDSTLTQSIQNSLFSFFVEYLVAKWYEYTNREGAEQRLNSAMSLIGDAKSKLYHKTKPKRS